MKNIRTTRYIVLCTLIIFAASCSEEKNCSQVKEGWDITINPSDSNEMKNFLVDSVKFTFINPSLGKDSTEPAVLRSKNKSPLINRFISYTFNQSISNNSKIIVSYFDKVWVISDIKIETTRIDLDPVGSRNACLITSYKINGTIINGRSAFEIKMN